MVKSRIDPLAPFNINLKLKRSKRGAVEISLSDLAEEDPKLLDALIEMPILTIKKIREANSVIRDNDTIMFTDIPKSLNKPISELRAKDVGTIVNVTGTIKRVTSPTSRVSYIQYECGNCKTMISIPQSGVKVTAPFVKCSCGNKEYNEVNRILTDLQEMEIEENSDSIGARQPQRIRILLEGELVDTTMSKIVVGNKLDVFGILENSPSYITNREGDRVVLDYLIRVLSITPREGFDEEIEITPEEEERIKDIASKNPLTILSDNLAPNISGLEHIKKAAVLYMAKGVTKNTVNGEKRRGFMHILVIGEGGLAKSTILQNIQKRSYNVRMVDGKDATKAGIVAMVNQDKYSGKWSFEAGDLVLANGGLLLLDEADKLPNSDRLAMHRPMEQGEAVLSKAGVKVTLQCNTGIFAVGNPKLGVFTKDQSILDQVDFSPTLLSRFDLIFILKDTIDRDMDMIKAKKILEVHAKEGAADINFDFFKKYIYYISKLKPTLTKEAIEKIESIYVSMREKSMKEGEKIGMPIGPRHLEGLVRLSEAHAKLRLSEKVELIDVDIAEDLFKHSLSDVGIDPEANFMDLSSLSTNVRSTKKERYFTVLNYLKEKAKSQEEFIKKEIYSELARVTNMKYHEVDEIFSLLYKEGDIYEKTTNRFRLTRNA